MCGPRFWQDAVCLSLISTVLSCCQPVPVRRALCRGRGTCQSATTPVAAQAWYLVPHLRTSVRQIRRLTSQICLCTSLSGLQSTLQDQPVHTHTAQHVLAHCELVELRSIVQLLLLFFGAHQNSLFSAWTHLVQADGRCSVSASRRRSRAAGLQSKSGAGDLHTA